MGLRAVCCTSLPHKSSSHSASRPFHCTPQYLTVTNLHFYFLDFFFMFVTESKFVVSCLLFLISINLDTLLNIYDRFMEHCIPKLFVHILLRLDCIACHSNDTPQESRHASISSRQMVIQYTCYRIYVRGLRGVMGVGREHTD